MHFTLALAIILLAYISVVVCPFLVAIFPAIKAIYYSVFPPKITPCSRRNLDCHPAVRNRVRSRCHKAYSRSRLYWSKTTGRV